MTIHTVGLIRSLNEETVSKPPINSVTARAKLLNSQLKAFNTILAARRQKGSAAKGFCFVVVKISILRGNALLLADTGCLTGKVAEIIQTGTTYATLLVNYYALNEW